LDEGLRVVESMLASREEQGDLLKRALHFNDPSQFLVIHSVNVAIFAIRLGFELGLSKGHQVELGMAGLLHEVGMCKIPDEIVHKKGRLTDHELEILRRHPFEGYEILKSMGTSHAYLAVCALQEHERGDGSGYPKGLKGDEIHEYAQIIGLVDVYEALTHSRPHKEKFPYFMSIKEILRSGKRCFQRRHLKALLNSLSLFPLHTYVRLNSNAVGKVIETYPDQPMRPKLQIIYDSLGRRESSERVVDLQENPLLFIVDSVPEQELKDVQTR
jgi:HD-GYP domain-containing protein (c-di-GMP phosphodiesterase class II)